MWGRLVFVLRVRPELFVLHARGIVLLLRFEVGQHLTSARAAGSGILCAGRVRRAAGTGLAEGRGLHVAALFAASLGFSDGGCCLIGSLGLRDRIDENATFAVAMLASHDSGTDGSDPAYAEEACPVDLEGPASSGNTERPATHRPDSHTFGHLQAVQASHPRAEWRTWACPQHGHTSLPCTGVWGLPQPRHGT